ncbi:hypothetical protein CTAM01_01042 [Colletotrichum tamarilloi]|uniref:Zn(2)-C6 fungal-type domain-containing protein n=1 Tax=Colletotrichum tamarilloi TaxID=1209934 RepID=A0ABQ9RSW5_9PEZI|nr:uncharacterized protein CTAM01_01042 [Colletotrichum tamarilloi]KAK1512112.1 hypothetical protein CTAM01_01042 [Colletotrichum tamarilloi]
MQADKGCWTCKQRKIGCDKSIPHCDNCVRTRRECAGYGIRLNWPDQLRSREKDLIVCPVVEIASAQEHPQTLGTRFLNTTHRHFRLATKRRVTWHQVMHRASVGPVASVTLYSPQLDEDGMLLVYYHSANVLNDPGGKWLSCRNSCGYYNDAVHVHYACTDLRFANINKVIGLFGCSVEVFDNISSINQIRTMILKSERSDIKRNTEQFRIVLQEKLESLVHFLSPDEVAHSTSAQIRDALATAELYRLASLLYLQRVVPVAGDEKKRISYLEQAYAAMKEVRVATSPWPVFIFACETRSEEQRIHILDILDRMDKIRNVGNVRVMRSVIENVWIQQDLRELVDATGTIPWWLCIESDLPVPWFA